MVLRHGMDGLGDQVSLETGFACEGESLTLQSQSVDADINVIVKRFGITGQLPQGFRMPSYGDFESVADYREALDLVREAQESFSRLPADLRNRFENDPAKLLDFMEERGTLQALRELGLAPKEEVKSDVQSASEVVAGKPAESASGKAAVA